MDTLRVPAPIGRLAMWLQVTSPWRVLGLAALARTAICGIWTTPNIDQWLLFARDPYGTPAIDPAAQFITASPLGPLVAHTVGAHDRFPYALVHLALLVLSVTSFVTLGRRVIGDRLTTAMVVVLFASPLSNVVLTWLGQPDAAMLGGLSVLGLASGIGMQFRRIAAALGAGAVMGFASFEQGLIALVVLAIASWAADGPGDREVVLAAMAGLLIGRGGVAAFLAASDAPNVTRSEWARSLGYGVFLRTFLYNLPAVVFSMFGAGWLLVGHGVARLRAAVPPSRYVVPALIISLAVGAIALDQTRVVSMVVWPTAIWLLRRADEASDAGLDPVVVALTLVGGLVIPPVVIWEGSPYISSWFEIRQGW